VCVMCGSAKKSCWCCGKEDEGGTEVGHGGSTRMKKKQGFWKRQRKDKDS